MPTASDNRAVFQQTCRILSAKQISSHAIIHEYHSPEIAQIAKPGQFVQIRVTEEYSPLLPRPMSVLSTDKTKGTIFVLFKVYGEATALLAKKKTGDSVGLLGPLGNTFKPERFKNLIVVAGGVGLPPLYFLLKSLDLFYYSVYCFSGFASKDDLFLAQELLNLDINVQITTDDGSYGIKGMVTEPVEKHSAALQSKGDTCLLACGPIQMLKAVQEIALTNDIPAQLSVETIMACGIGICQGCTIQKRVGTVKRCEYHLVCVDGPIFSEKAIVFEND